MTENLPAVVAPEPAALVAIDPATYDRSKRLGGSDIAAVIGKSPWRTKFDLWKDKTTPRIPDQRPVTGPKKRGIRWEAVVGEMLVESLQAEGHTVEIVRTNNRYEDATHPFLAAEIDWELRLNGNPEIINAELKTVHPFKAKSWGESGGDECPVDYVAQVQHGLGVTRRRTGILAALFGADELRTYLLPADDTVIAWLRQEAVAFWTNHVLANVPPEPQTIEDMLKRFPLDGTQPPLLADEELVIKVMRMRQIAAQIKALEGEGDVITLELMRAMKDCTSIVMPNGKDAVEWKLRSGSWFDETALKETHPKTYKEFVRKWEKRVFKLKPFATEGLL